MSSTATPKPILLEVGPGEMIDKITILKIKSERITDAEKLVNIRHELAVLLEAHAIHINNTEEMQELEASLKKVNEDLWEIEDDIRQCEADKDFGSTFIALARSVYRENDIRAKLKKDINLLAGSSIIEEKSYTSFE